MRRTLRNDRGVYGVRLVQGCVGDIEFIVTESGQVTDAGTLIQTISAPGLGSAETAVLVTIAPRSHER